MNLQEAIERATEMDHEDSSKRGRLFQRCDGDHELEMLDTGGEVRFFRCKICGTSFSRLGDKLRPVNAPPMPDA